MVSRCKNCCFFHSNIENNTDTAMTFISDFKKFIFRGNVVDLAVGVIIGAAFGKMVTSLVDDIIMPPIGCLTGNTDFSQLMAKVCGSGPTASNIKYGQFIQIIINFLIIAFCIFLLVKLISALYKKEEAAPAPPSTQELLLAEIRDILKTKPAV